MNWNSGRMFLSLLAMLAFLFFFILRDHNLFTSASNKPPTPYPFDVVTPYSPVYRCGYCDDNLARPHVSKSSISKLRKIKVFGPNKTNATYVTIVITLLNIIVYKLRQYCYGDDFVDKKIPSYLGHGCRLFSIDEIKLATDNFDDALFLGKGGFGKVYRGHIDGRTNTVAVKRLDSNSNQGDPEFWAEIEMLSKFRHSHLVSLIGYCNDDHEKILVYEYMPRGSLSDHLYENGRNDTTSVSHPLSWEQRLKSCIGAARGLDYLHTGTGIRDRVIHRDVKCGNILLDESWEAKISDFGLSKIVPANQERSHVITEVKGTFGYLDPAYCRTHMLTRKSDVYAFGVVLFSVLCGKPAVVGVGENRRALAECAQECIKEGTLDQIIDPRIRGQISPDCRKVFAEIASKCLHKRPKERPTMADVVAKLEFSLASQKADPVKVHERVQRRKRRKVDLVSPIPKPPAEDPKKPDEKETPKLQEKKEEPQVITVILKVHMHCENCPQDIKKHILRMEGIESADPDLKASQVIVKGVFDVQKLVRYVRKKTGKHAVADVVERKS